MLKLKTKKQKGEPTHLSLELFETPFVPGCALSLLDVCLGLNPDRFLNKRHGLK